MKSLIHTKRKFRKGFTLIELLVSIVLFMIFLGVVSTSYVSIVRSQREANQVRKMYSDVRALIETLNEEIRLSAIDYDCYAGNTDYIGGVLNTCDKNVSGSISPDGSTHYLSLLRKDGLERTLFSYDGTTILEKKWQKTAAGWSPEPGFESDTGLNLLSNFVDVKNFSFIVFPHVNPYSNDSKVYSNNATQFQPQVTILMKATNSKNVHTTFNFDFQTTISSRVYSRAS